MIYEARGCGARLCKDIECKAEMEGVRAGSGEIRFIVVWSLFALS